MDRSSLLARSVAKVAGSALVTLFALAFAPMAFGWTPVVITSGSMMPAIRPGDIVVVQPVDAAAVPLQVGEVATYRQPGNDRRTTHRVHELIEDGSYRTKGDANQRPDSDLITPDRVEGRGRMLVPYAGLVSTSPAVRAMAMLALIATAVRLRRRGRTSDPAAVVSAAAVPASVGPAGGTTATGRTSVPASVWTAGVTQRRGHRRTRRSVVAALTAAAVAIVVPTVAVSAFVGATANASSLSADVVAPPTQLSASASCVNAQPQVDLSWVASATADIDGYALYRSDSGGAFQQIASVAAPGTSTTDANVPAGDYRYRAQTTAGTWSSVDSNTVELNVPACA